MARKSEALYEEPEYANVQTYNGFEIESDIPVGARHRGTRTAKYPFDMLEVGQSFHVAATADMPKPAVTLAGAVTNANAKWSHPDPSGRTELRKVSVFQLDAEGKRTRTEDGGFVKLGEEMKQVPAMIAERSFTIRTVGSEDHKGPGCRIFREV
jgi:hypothetical protein